MDKSSKNLLSSDKQQQLKLQKIVQQTIDEEKLMVENLLHQPEEIISRGQKISDKVASFGGSWKFIILFAIVLFIWILFNSLALTNTFKFDPYPYILMNLILSCIAALQAPIIMMSQNRQEEKDRKRSENDYLINLKAELELRSLHQKVDLLLEEQIQMLIKSQAEQIEMIKKIQKKLDSKL